jgi:hypothetical protein
MNDHSPVRTLAAECRPAPCHCADRDLLGRYSAQLIAEAAPWRERSALLDTAAQFLEWWRKRYVGEEYCVCAAGAEPGQGPAWSDLRETWLRNVCPDHALRPDERARANRFLRFLTGIGAAVAQRPAPTRPGAAHRAAREIEVAGSAGDRGGRSGPAYAHGGGPTGG